jgi:hypothetical protein
MTAPPVAPFNPNPKWPGGYVQVLRDQGIEESNIPHFLRWVRGSFAGPSFPLRTLRDSFPSHGLYSRPTQTANSKKFECGDKQGMIP